MSFSNGDKKFLDEAGLSHLWGKIKNRLDAKIDISTKGEPNGVAELGMDGKVITDQLPAGVTIKCKTTAEWNRNLLFIPDKGEIIIYSDRGKINVAGQDVDVPGIKIGDGLAYAVDLPFVGLDREMFILSKLGDHVFNEDIHVTPLEKARWNAKLNYDISEETLIFNRM